MANEPIVEEDEANEVAANEVEANAMEQVANADEQLERVPCVLANIPVRNPGDSCKIPSGRLNRQGMLRAPVDCRLVAYTTWPVRFAYLQSSLIIEKANPSSE
ncbi:hypothetical protein ACE6H2_023464 [Prunus campanulata]